MKIRVTIQTNKVGSKCTETVEVNEAEYKNDDGSLNEDAINDMAKDVIWNMAEWGWEVVGE